MNNKILSVVLVLGIASTWFTAISSANSGKILIQNSELRELLKKSRSGEELSTEEYEVLKALRGKIQEWWLNKWVTRWFQGYGKRAGYIELTAEEEQMLEGMNHKEIRDFFKQKRIEKQVRKDENKEVIDKLIIGQSLTSREESIRLEMLANFESEKNTHPMRRDNGDIIGKLLAWDELIDEDIAILEKMKQKREMRKEMRNGKNTYK